MDTAADDPGAIRFYLITRPTMHDQSEVVLRLYRHGRMVSETVISTVRDDKARMVMLMSRMQLFRLGYDEHVATLQHVDPFQIEAG